MKNCHDQILAYEHHEVRMNEDGRADIFGKAKYNRSRVKNGLAANNDPEPIGMRTQGSYAMRTLIHYADGDYDIDDGVYFKRDDLKKGSETDMSALNARHMIGRAAADERFNKQPEVRDNCVRVFYNEGYHIDVPVYREVAETDLLTGEKTKHFEIASKDWRRSDPLSVPRWFREQNTRSTDATANNNDGQLIRLVRLVKAFARSRKAWAGPIATGFAITKLVCDEFSEDQKRDDRALKSIAQRITDRLTTSQAIKHPTLPENISDEGDNRAQFLRDRLEENLEHLKILDKADCSHEDAMTAWDRFFNTDWFSKQPDPDEQDDLSKAVSGPAVVKRGENRYA